jgi:hypothetical protein
VHPFPALRIGQAGNEGVQFEHQNFLADVDLSKVTAVQVVEVELKLNRTPRKCLDYLTPNEIFKPQPLLQWPLEDGLHNPLV